MCRRRQLPVSETYCRTCSRVFCCSYWSVVESARGLCGPSLHLRPVAATILRLKTRKIRILDQSPSRLLLNSFQFRAEHSTWAAMARRWPRFRCTPRRCKPLVIDKTEVTNYEYQQFVEKTGHEAPSHWINKKPIAGQELLPVTFVSHSDAVAFAKWRSERDGLNWRLPTEEEWEYAARGGDQENIYPWGNTWTEGNAITKSSGANEPKPVGSAPNDKTRWGAHGHDGQRVRVDRDQGQVLSRQFANRSKANSATGMSFGALRSVRRRSRSQSRPRDAIGSMAIPRLARSAFVWCARSESA